MNLEDIYICDTEDTCTAIPDTETYRKSKEAFHKAESNLLNALNDEQKALFSEFMDIYNDLLGQEDQERYKQGLAAGIRITAEAFLLDNNKNFPTK